MVKEAKLGDRQVEAVRIAADELFGRPDADGVTWFRPMTAISLEQLKTEGLEVKSRSEAKNPGYWVPAYVWVPKDAVKETA